MVKSQDQMAFFYDIGGYPPTPLPPLPNSNNNNNHITYNNNTSSSNNKSIKSLCCLG